MFVNRSDEMSMLRRRYASPEAELLVVYGRRRVGKTELLKHFIKGKPHLYFMADQRSEKETLESVSMLAAEHFHDEFLLQQPFRSWDVVFSYLTSKTVSGEKFVLVLDEYPYIAESTPSVSSILQKHWDMRLKDCRIMVVLCGSSISFMENDVLGYRSPLYGRRTGQLEVLPFSYLEAREMFPNASPEALMEIFSVCGGIPAYLRYFSEDADLWENISNAILHRDSVLHNEVSFLLMQELRTPQKYFAILRALSLGRTKINDISQSTGIDRQAVNKYIDTLMRLRIVGKRIPAFDHPQKSRKGLYFIRDNYFRFWFRFMYPYLTHIEEGRPHIALEHMKAGMTQYMGPIFESVCRDFMKKKNMVPGFHAVSVDAWWDKSEEIDIVSLGEGSTLLIGGCKYSAKAIGTDIAENLRRKGTLLTTQPNEYVLFSRKGFTENLRSATYGTNFHLISLDMLHAMK